MKKLLTASLLASAAAASAAYPAGSTVIDFNNTDVTAGSYTNPSGTVWEFNGFRFTQSNSGNGNTIYGAGFVSSSYNANWTSPDGTDYMYEIRGGVFVERIDGGHFSLLSLDYANNNSGSKGLGIMAFSTGNANNATGTVGDFGMGGNASVAGKGAGNPNWVTINFSNLTGFGDIKILEIWNQYGTGQMFPNVFFYDNLVLGTVVPEASTYGIALGGLALAGALIRRRRSSK